MGGRACPCTHTLQQCLWAAGKARQQGKAAKQGEEARHATFACAGAAQVSTLPGPLRSQEGFEQERAALTGGLGCPYEQVVCYCTAGYRSGLYAADLRQHGVPAFNLEGSILGWVSPRRGVGCRPADMVAPPPAMAQPHLWLLLIAGGERRPGPAREGWDRQQARPVVLILRNRRRTRACPYSTPARARRRAGYTSMGRSGRCSRRGMRG